MYFLKKSGYTFYCERSGRMLISFIRALILLVVIICALRLMGKRQIGQLQPAELVVTILLSEIAATPMQDNDVPMLNSLVAIFVLVSLEIIMSAASLKSMKLRTLLQGNSIVVIKDGKIDQYQMKRLRLSLDDLFEALRKKDVFDISEVQYAIAETDGSLSVLLKNDCRTVSRSDMDMTGEDESVPSIVIMDGKEIKDSLFFSPEAQKAKEKILKKSKTSVKDIFLMTVNKDGDAKITEKEKKK